MKIARVTIFCPKIGSRNKYYYHPPQPWHFIFEEYTPLCCFQLLILELFNALTLNVHIQLIRSPFYGEVWLSENFADYYTIIKVFTWKHELKTNEGYGNILFFETLY